MVNKAESQRKDLSLGNFKVALAASALILLPLIVISHNWDANNTQQQAAPPQPAILAGQTSVTVACSNGLESPAVIHQTSFGGPAWNSYNDPDQPITTVVSFGCGTVDSVSTPAFVVGGPSDKNRPFDNIREFNVGYHFEQGVQISNTLGPVEEWYPDGHSAVLGQLILARLSSSEVEIAPAPEFV